MADITPEELGELDRQACETYKRQLLIDYIKDPAYMVMWETFKGYFPLGNTVTVDDGELKVSLKNVFRSPDAYLDLYNIDMKDIKVYKEIKLDE